MQYHLPTDFNFFLLSFITVISALLSFFVLFRKKSQAAIWFGGVTLSVAFWSFTNAMCFIAPTVERGIFWAQMSYFSAILIAFTFFYFSSIFPESVSYRERKYIPKKYQKILVNVFFVIVSVCIFLPEVTVKRVLLNPWEIINGPGIYFFAFYFLVLMGWAFRNLAKKYFFCEGNERIQLKYLFMGCALSALFGGTFNLLLPFLGIYKFVWFGPLAALILIGFISYAILRHRLMDIRVAAGRGLVYTFSVVSVALIAYSLFLLGLLLGFPSALKVVGATTISALFFHPLFSAFEEFAGKYLYYSFYSSEKTLKRLGKELTEILDLRELTNLIASTLLETLKTKRVVIILREGDAGKFAIAKNIGFKEENGISLVRDNFLTEWLEKNKKPLVYEELVLYLGEESDEEKKKRIEHLLKDMNKIEAELCLPLIFKEKIVGIIVLGEKKSGDPYFHQDLDLLSNLSYHFSVALQNAWLYSKVEDFSKNLERKVEEQVKELKRAYRKLQRLDKVKTEFMSIVSHQLRTPLSIIKGHLSMVSEGVYEKDKEKERKVLQSVYEANERLIALVNDVLNISRIQAGRVEFEKEKANLVEVIRNTVERMMPSLNGKKVELIFKEPLEELPEIEIDVSKIENVMINLIDNAIKYTQEGEVTVSVKKEDDYLKISIKDTGEGMSEEEVEKLFETFSRGGAGKKHWIQGAGLGLYIARQFVEMHKGKVWAESEGKGKGSQFYVTIPLSS